MPRAVVTAFVALALALLVAPAPAAAQAAPTEVAAAARELGLGRVAEELAAAARPSLRLERRIVRFAPAARGTSRLGGAPDLPARTRWPRCGRRPMAFLGQIRLGDAPVGELPREGLLSFFASVTEDGAGSRFWMWGGECARVLHTADGVALRRRRAPRANPRMVLRTARVRLVPESVLPVTPPVALAEEEEQGYERLRERLSPVTFRDGQWGPLHRLLGHPEWAQLDPVVEGCPGGAAGGWVALFQLDHDLRLGYEVADGGRQMILVRRADLRAGRFDRVCSAFESA